MRSFPLVISLALVTACTADPKEGAECAVYSSDGSVTYKYDAADCDGIIPDDSVTSEDTAIEDETDDAAEDTGTETEIEDPNIPKCEFLVDTWDGEVMMGNTLSVSLNSESPSGSAEPGRINVLTVDFTADDPNCADLLVSSYGVRGEWTDNARSGWHPTWVSAYIDGEYVSGEDPYWPTGYVAFAEMDSVLVRAGETVTVTISSLLSDASAELDDSVQFSIISASIYDGENDPVDLAAYEDLATGNPITF